LRGQANRWTPATANGFTTPVNLQDRHFRGSCARVHFALPTPLQAE
jgi:hypothetical protein